MHELHVLCCQTRTQQIGRNLGRIDLSAVFDRALDNARVAARRVTFPVRLAEKDVVQAAFTSPCEIDPFRVPLADKVAFLKATDEMLDQPGVFQRIGGLSFVRKQIDRMVVTLFYWEGMPYTEIEEVTGLTVSAIKSRLFRARRRIAELLVQEETYA